MRFRIYALNDEGTVFELAQIEAEPTETLEEARLLFAGCLRAVADEMDLGAGNPDLFGGL